MGNQLVYEPTNTLLSNKACKCLDHSQLLPFKSELSHFEDGNTFPQVSSCEEGDEEELDSHDLSPKSASTPHNPADSIQLDHDNSSGSTSNKNGAGTRPGVERGVDSDASDEPKRVEYSVLLTHLKAKDYTRALTEMEADTEEFGRFLKRAQESHLVDPWDIMSFVIRSKFFDCVKNNNKHASAVYSVLYTALDMDVNEALQFLVLHTTTELDSTCRSIVNGIVSAPISLTSDEAQEEDIESKDESPSNRPTSTSSGDMAVVNGLSKMFEAVSKIMNEYAYAESFGIKRTLMLLRAAQPVLEKHALVLLNHWLRSSHFDEYALAIPGNDWNKYEDFQLAKLSEKLPANQDQPPSRPSVASEVPAVRVGGKVDPMNVVITLEQFSAISQLTESYKGYIHRTYEKGIEEMKAKGHSFVDLGDDPNSTSTNGGHHDIQIHGNLMVHNIRTYVAEPAQLFFFVSRKGESYKQLESWHLGTALLAAFGTQEADKRKKPAALDSTGPSNSHRPRDEASEHHGSGKPTINGDGELEASSPSVVPSTPSSSAIFSLQKIDHVFALLMRSIERSISARQPELSHSLLRRAVALCPSFLYSLLLRRFNTALPKISISQQNDIAATIFDFHGEDQDDVFLARKKEISPTKQGKNSRPTATDATTSSSSGPKLSSIFSSGLGGLMNLVGTNASGAVSSAAAGISSSSRFGIHESCLVNTPALNVWHKADLALICASLNDISMCPKYFGKLQEDMERKVKFFEKGEATRKILFEDLQHFKSSLPSVFNADSSLQSILLVLTPSLSYHLHMFWKTSYEMGEEEFKASEINDPWASSTSTWLKASLNPFKGSIQPELMESLIGSVSALISSQLERLLLRKRVSAFGALALDSHIRAILTTLNSFLPSMSSFAARRRFATLKEITTVLCLASEYEILELWNASHEDQSQYFDPTLASIDPSQVVKSKVEWHLSADRLKAYMKCRSEWKPAIIDGLQLS